VLLEQGSRIYPENRKQKFDGWRGHSRSLQTWRVHQKRYFLILTIETRANTPLPIPFYQKHLHSILYASTDIWKEHIRLRRQRQSPDILHCIVEASYHSYMPPMLPCSTCTCTYRTTNGGHTPTHISCIVTYRWIMHCGGPPEISIHILRVAYDTYAFLLPSDWWKVTFFHGFGISPIHWCVLLFWAIWATYLLHNVIPTVFSSKQHCPKPMFFPCLTYACPAFYMECLLPTEWHRASEHICYMHPHHMQQ